MLLKHLFHLHRLMDEVPADTGGGGGGGDTDLNIDIAATADSIAADLGLGLDDKEGGDADETLDGSAATPPAKAKAATPPLDAAKAGQEAAARVAKLTAAKAALAAKQVDITGKKDEEILKLAEEAAKPPVRNLPKSWKKEHEAIWKGLSPEAQAYIEQREAQVEEGFKANAADNAYGKSMKELMQPYEALLTSQGVKDHGHAVRAVMNAHFVLSTKSPEEKARFMAQLAKNYQVDAAKVAEYYAADPAPKLSPLEQQLSARLSAIENGQKQTYEATLEAVKAESAAEVEAFASDPKNPYFNEVMGEVALLMQDPKLSLAAAYERAVYANPVTRAKELTRLKDEAEKTAREEAEKAAAAAEKARGTKIRGQEQERASPDLLGSMEDTMRSTYREINSRT